MASIVGFIDLLATKESSRVSQLSTDAAIKSFLGCLVLNKIILGDEKCEIKCLSDSAFFQLPASESGVLFLQRLRKDLFDRKLYFKCGIVSGELSTSLLDTDFLSTFLDAESVRERLGGKTPKELAEEISIDVQGFYFSHSAVRAYELHEAFKGIGYSISNSAKDVIEKSTVSSLYFVDDRLEKVKAYTDLTFDNNFELGESAAREVAPDQELPDLTKPSASDENRLDVGLTYINILLRSLQIATIKNKSYTKYYLPTLISMLRSTSFSSIHVEQGQIVGAPVIYRRLVVDNALGRMRPRPKGVNKILACLLDATLNGLDVQVQALTHNAADIDEPSRPPSLDEAASHEAKSVICAEFSTLPGFVSSIHESGDNFLSAKNREYFLDSVVK